MTHFNPLPLHIQRVCMEKVELDEKLKRLKSFVDSTGSESIPLKAKQLLIEQSVVMGKYSDILHERIILEMGQTNE